MFDEQPDADSHGECRDEIRRQAQQIELLKAALRDYDGLQLKTPSLALAHKYGELRSRHAAALELIK
jgi:hypothetical protein